MKVVFLSMTCIRYMPTLRPPDSGSCVITAGSVMNGAGSPGQQRWIGRRPRSTSSPRSTISWQGPLPTVFGRESATDLSFCSPRTFWSSPLGGCISSTSATRCATSSSRSTPNARHIRRSVPNWLIKSGCWDPFRFSNSSAGPPAFTVRSVISVISRSGSTSTETRTSSPSRSSSAIQSRRSFTARVYGPSAYATVALAAALALGDPVREVAERDHEQEGHADPEHHQNDLFPLLGGRLDRQQRMEMRRDHGGNLTQPSTTRSPKFAELLPNSHQPLTCGRTKAVL